MRRGRLAVLAALLATAAAAQQPRPHMEPRKAAPAEAQVLSGGYEIASEASGRKCLALLRPADAPGGYAIGFPAQCRAALPVLAGVTAWDVETMREPPHARFRLVGPRGAVVLDFIDEGPDNAGKARDGAGAAYHIRPTTGATLAQRVASLTGARPAPPVVFTPPPPDPAAMTRASGAYGMVRAGGRDTGCRLVLGGAGVTEGEARLDPGCKDAGLNTFGPARWNISGGALWLIGRRGRLNFDATRSGGWEKAPGQGEPLSLTPAPR